MQVVAVRGRWRHVVAALERARPGIAERAMPLLGPPAPPVFDGLVTALINELAEPESSDAVLILDDYHVIDSAPVHESVMFLLDHLPAALHLVIASRADPPLALARLRARGHLESNLRPGRGVGHHSVAERIGLHRVMQRAKLVLIVRELVEDQHTAWRDVRRQMQQDQDGRAVEISVKVRYQHTIAGAFPSEKARDCGREPSFLKANPFVSNVGNHAARGERAYRRECAIGRTPESGDSVRYLVGQYEDGARLEVLRGRFADFLRRSDGSQRDKDGHKGRYAVFHVRHFRFPFVR